ncbi:MAG: DNA polymerase I [Eubacteriales bacterium]|nr:DNA polymerase I [Eubacteriales bacterium]
MKDKILLIDGHSILSRAFYGIPLLTNSKGIYTNAIYGFLNIMFKALDTEEADHIAVAFDMERSKLKRTKLFPEYKGTRKGMPEELLCQVPLMQEMLGFMNIPIMTLEGYEADDILGTVAKKAQEKGYEVTILSGDRDLLQLSDEHIKISIPKTSKGKTEIFNYYPEDVKNEYKVTPLEFIDLKALMGDTSDNIPGVPSIGEKTATALITTYHSIEELNEHIEEVKPPRAKKALEEHFDMAVLSKKLATIDINSPFELDFEASKIINLYTAEALSLCREYEFKSLIPRFSEGDNSSDEKTELDISMHKLIKDRYFASIVLGDALLEKKIGFYAETVKKENKHGEQLNIFDIEKTEIAIGLVLSKDRYYTIISNDDYSREELLNDVADMLKALIKNGCEISTLKLKPQLKLLGVGRNACFSDISIAAYLLNPLKESYEYYDLARDYMDVMLPQKEELVEKNKLYEAFYGEDKEALKKASEYILYCAYIPYLASQNIKKKLKEEKCLKLYEDIELPLVYSLNDMELEGVRVDQSALNKYAEELKLQIDSIEKEIYKDAGEEFNINSPSQLGVILFEKLGLKGGKKTKTGYSTAAEVLNKLAPDYPVVEKILNYRKLAKLYSTYAIGLQQYISADGRIHGTFNQTITATGRISSTDPNLQNIPVRTDEGREFRKVFIPKEGYTFVDADYSQVELRILASLSEDDKLISAYRDAVDVHSLTASEVFKVPISEVTADMRRNAKAVNFGIVYGISAFGLGEGLSIGRKEAQEYIDQYFETYPEVKNYLDKQVQNARDTGCVKTLFGRIRPVPEINSSNFMQRSFGERVAMNSPIQGTAADIMKIAMNKVNMALSGLNEKGERVSEPFKSKIVLQVHDELLVETALDELEAVKKLIKTNMENAARLHVKLSADVNSGDNWDDCH